MEQEVRIKLCESGNGCKRKNRSCYEGCKYILKSEGEVVGCLNYEENDFPKKFVFVYSGEIRKPLVDDYFYINHRKMIFQSVINEVDEYPIFKLIEE
jgi:hypothetical protein